MNTIQPDVSKSLGPIYLVLGVLIVTTVVGAVFWLTQKDKTPPAAQSTQSMTPVQIAPATQNTPTEATTSTPPVTPIKQTEVSATPLAPTNFAITTDTVSGYSFQYPKSISGTYVKAQKWPPKITIQNAPSDFICVPTTTKTDTGFSVNLVTIGTSKVCITTRPEGAAGTTYTTYDLTWVLATKPPSVITLEFITREPTSCTVYDEPKRSACMKEKTNFNPADIARQIVPTVKKL